MPTRLAIPLVVVFFSGPGKDVKVFDDSAGYLAQ